MIKNRLRQILFDRDMSIRELAAACDTSYSTVYNFAHQKGQSAHYGLMAKVCEVLRIQPGDMLIYEPNQAAKG